MFKISQSMLYMLIFTMVASGLTWKIVKTAYENVDDTYMQDEQYSQ